MTKKRAPKSPGRKDYEQLLHGLQVELVKLQKHFISCEDRILVILEGRDAAGKDGAIKRIVQHLSPRETRVVALGRPSDRERTQWYFQRFIPHLPAAQEFVLFNRSWYNRAGVEHVMGFCTPAEHREFLTSVIEFEQMLARSGIRLLKYYLDISRGEQRRRLRARRKDPLKQWKVSPIDQVALRHWKDYSRARDSMLEQTHHAAAPWTIVRADDKRLARVNLIRDILRRLHYKPKNEKLIRGDRGIVVPFSKQQLRNGALAR
jgi:polyphosphate kinase 2